MTESPERKAINRAAEIVSSFGRLAKLVGITRQAISQWDKVPADRVLAVERATGGQVTRSELRPDLYPPQDAA